MFCLKCRCQPNSVLKRVSAIYDYDASARRLQEHSVFFEKILEYSLMVCVLVCGEIDGYSSNDVDIVRLLICN